jgi:hypothetical protein
MVGKKAVEEWVMFVIVNTKTGLFAVAWSASRVLPRQYKILRLLCYG